MPLSTFDHSLIAQRNPVFLVGVDEAGRGPLAGPVVACAAHIPPAVFPLVSPFVNDSKKLTPKKREAAFSAMLGAGVRSGFGWAMPEEIDRCNILEATFNAMGTAVKRLARLLGVLPPAGLFVLVDGPYKIKRLAVSQEAVVDGDARSLSIAAASIFAKVLRDRWMARLETRHPGYGLAKHKGYGTASHLSALRVLGPSAVHRLSFAPVKMAAISEVRSQK
ncbi:MAG: ribonuclease HII [Elusimicrobia bacterium GWF2_52_66]|nr:MAG: ribonuclease HII [Elusimicrobia bacterium GWA2_51_34]OGR88110.1 MAG: ribonuclease HII [Elusimicrobia bacterium GWF2_52_66]